MLSPKNTKWRKPHALKYDGFSKGNLKVDFGKFGLRAEQGNYITANQIEAARVVINRFLSRGGKLWIRIFPHLSLTKKPAEVRMGSGKGSPDIWVAVVKKNTIMFELDKVTEVQAREAFRKASHKLPVKCSFVLKDKKND